MNKITQLCTILLVALLLSVSPVHAQTDQITTTLSVAITDTRTQAVTVAAATSITAGSTVLMVDREIMFVNAVNGTTLRVMRGYGGSRAYTHASSATVYVGPASGVGTFIAFAKYGTCTAGNETYLPQMVGNITSAHHGALVDCFAGNWQINDNTPRYAFTLAPSARRSAAVPAAGTASALTSQAGGAQSATTGNGAAGGTLALTAGAGGAGGTSSGTAGAGGAVSLTGGAGAGTITGGAGGTATVKGGAGGNGTSAGGSGGNVIIQAGAVGTGGTGSAGVVQIKDAADATKIVAINASGLTTAVTNTLAFGATTARTTTFPDITGTVPTVVSCGATSTGTANCANTSATAVPRIYFGVATLGSNAQVITFGTAFTSTATYSCVANDITTRANVVQMVQTSSSTATITNTTGASDVVNYICVGY